MKGSPVQVRASALGIRGWDMRTDRADDRIVVGILERESLGYNGAVDDPHSRQCVCRAGTLRFES